MNPRYVLLASLLFAASFSLKAAQPQAFEIRDGHFMIDGKPEVIMSGEMHYARIPHQYWRHRLKMMKAMGLNAVATYVFWNIHEPKPGQWDFSGDKDLASYIKTAAEEGLSVILRPGPYVCAEWEFGGYPWWLQNIEGLELRRDNEKFLERVGIYLERLNKEVGDLQVTKGGPIVMVQVENEFGSYAAQRKDIPLEEHRAYNAKIKEMLTAAGFDAPMFTSDGTWLFEGGSIEGALPTGNGENNIEMLRERVNQYHGGQGPYLVAEFYTGWLAHWAEPHPAIDASRIARKTDEYLSNGISFNFYMVHGGTNFGFMNGANYDNKHDIQPDLTSYDYDAPISEAGWATPKYDSLRNVIAVHTGRKLPEPPKPAPVIEIPAIGLSGITDLLSYLKLQKPVVNDQVKTFEELGQGYGYVLYSRHFNQPISGTMEIEGLRDYATVYVNGERVGWLNRYDRNYSMEIDIPFNARLDILVENSGRINYGAEIVNNTKGIVRPVVIAGTEITGDWEMYGLPFDSDMSGDIQAREVRKSQPRLLTSLKGLPVLYRGMFDLGSTGDTFLDMTGWGKGIVFVNGHNLGRYWNVGPQQTLFVPGVWLLEGKNTIVIFEQLNDDPKNEIKTTITPVLHDLRTDLL
ncbi:beta-galactosidase [uncultured Alistipes sp.]|uniref:glycoside hydrolase family 35 protein n=1 Tax=uncultured Alistipes sp. TaxID=538949 RepID=UPI0035A6FCFA